MVEILVKKSQFTLIWDLVPSFDPPLPPENWNLDGTWHFEFWLTSLLLQEHCQDISIRWNFRKWTNVAKLTLLEDTCLISICHILKTHSPSVLWIKIFVRSVFHCSDVSCWYVSEYDIRDLHVVRGEHVPRPGGTRKVWTMPETDCLCSRILQQRYV